MASGTPRGTDVRYNGVGNGQVLDLNRTEDLPDLITKTSGRVDAHNVRPELTDFLRKASPQRGRSRVACCFMGLGATRHFVFVKGQLLQHQAADWGLTKKREGSLNSG